jgi:hypothetical protein
MNAQLLRLTRTTILALLACVGLVAGGAVATTSVASAAPATIRFTGTVTETGGYPLAGVKVQVVRADHEDSDWAVTTTDSHGRFITPKILANASMNYLLEATDPTGRHQTTYTEEFAATLANRTQNISMAKAAIIRGQVSTKDGDIVRPATHVIVEANGTDNAGNPAGGNAFTTSSGEFSLGGLPSGTYSLAFDDNDEDGTRVGPRFRTICYDNVPLTDVEPNRCDGATLVKVVAGTVTTIHPQVLDHRLGGLSGAVTDSAGNLLQYVTVDVYAANDQRFLGEDRTFGEANWAIDGIDYVGKVKIVASDVEGNYRTTWYVNAIDFAHANALELQDEGQIDDITIALPLN